MPQKKCSECKEFKNLECFYKNKIYRDGRMSSCKECRKQYQKKYNEEHKEEIKRFRDYEKRNQHRRIRRKTDSYFRLNWLMSKGVRRIKDSSIKQGQSWKTLVPYTLTELKKHLKRTLPDGYTWKDFMEGKLHIDHILPRAIFQYEKAEDIAFQICWGLDNLRLLPIKENLNKGKKLIKPFQKNFDIEVKVKRETKLRKGKRF